MAVDMFMKIDSSMARHRMPSTRRKSTCSPGRGVSATLDRPTTGAGLEL